MSEQEIVSDGSLFITRTEVPGGWVYNSFDKGNKILGSCFVPNPTRDALFDEMRGELNACEFAIERLLDRKSADVFAHGQLVLSRVKDLITRAEGSKI